MRPTKPRTVPINLNQTIQIKDDYDIELPPGYSVDEIPDPIKLDMVCRISEFQPGKGQRPALQPDLHGPRGDVPAENRDLQKLAGVIPADNRTAPCSRSNNLSRRNQILLTPIEVDTEKERFHEPHA